MDFGEASDDEADRRKVRVKFVTKIPSIRVTETPVAVPESLQRYGLSEVVNHLLGRDPPTPFDMLVMGRFLRSSLRSVMQRYALSGEAVLEVEYLPALRQPTEAEHAEQPDWVSTAAGAGEGLETFVTGCYDGCLRVYGPDCKVTSLTKAHHLPVTALCAVPTWPPGGGGHAAGFLSGSKDMTARLWRMAGSGSNASLEPVAVLRGHANSISAVHAVSAGAGSGSAIVYTGDWSGRVCMWDAACLGEDSAEAESNGGGASATQGAKRRKTGESGSAAAAAAAVSDQTIPLAAFRAHAQAVTGLAGPRGGGGGGGGQAAAVTLYSASLDRAVKTWDAERQDCVHTLNAPKAVTCLGCSDSGRMLATGHPDARVRIWDTRKQGETLTRASLSSHKQWITDVKWAPGSETMVLSCAQDGAVKLWDIRSTLPLHSAQAHKGKALCCGWQDGKIISGGEDGAVKTYTVPERNND
ncbi:unnamed protein product [Pylaiella littoralis]